mmetsp:Transcript_118834/g.296336  ORF Transcript_118834/g.296336 Transcript_118834/m.296336 type:complete len:229 (-) Transcript_118834:2768-3454(-)
MAIGDLQPKRNHVVLRASHDPLLASAEGVRTSDRHASPVCVRTRWVDHLLVISVARKLEALFARHPNAHAVGEAMSLPRNLGHPHPPPGGPRPGHIVAVDEWVELARCRPLLHHLPRDLSSTVSFVSTKSDVEQCALRPLKVPAVDQPEVALLMPLGAFCPDLHARILCSWVHRVAVVLLQSVIESFHPRFAQAGEVMVHAVTCYVQRMPSGPTVPRTLDVEVAARHW